MVDVTVSPERRDFYVYVIFRPNGVPCYVGKGTGGRWGHGNRKTHNQHLMRLSQKAGGRLPICKVREGITNAQAVEAEIALIAAIGRGTKGPLVNLTDGGDGAVGNTHSAETRAKIGASHRGRRQTPEHIAALVASRKGRRNSPEAAAKISAALKGRPKSPEHRAAAQAAKKGKPLGPMSAEQRAAIGRAHKGRKRSETEMVAVRAAWAAMTDEQRALKSARITAALTGKKLSAEHRARISEVQRNLTPEQRAARSAKLSAALKGRKLSPEALARRTEAARIKREIRARMAA